LDERKFFFMKSLFISKKGNNGPFSKYIWRNESLFKFENWSILQLCILFCIFFHPGLTAYLSCYKVDFDCYKKFKKFLEKKRD